MKTSTIWRHHLWLVLFAATLVGGCVRDELEHVCTPVENGELVISEVRGRQSEVDTYGQWIELYNRSGTTLSIAGIRLRMYNNMGLSERQVMVRDEGLTVAPGGYVVLGQQSPDNLPDHVDYGYESDLNSDLHDAGVIELYVCNELVDTVVYPLLPTVGTYSFDGDLDLTVDSNDLESNWCNDASAVVNPTEVGTPGSPGAENRPCN